LDSIDLAVDASVKAMPATSLRAGGLAPHAPVRHHARTAGRDGGGGAQWAQLNPAGLGATPLTVAEVLASRMVSHPLTVRDCCLVTDGGGALVMTSAARARSLRQAAGVRAGRGRECLSHQAISSMPDLT
jgi:hypothetical protein